VIELPPGAARSQRTAAGLYHRDPEKPARRLRLTVSEALWKKKPVVRPRLAASRAKSPQHTGLAGASVKARVIILFCFPPGNRGKDSGNTASHVKEIFSSRKKLNATERSF